MPGGTIGTVGVRLATTHRGLVPVSTHPVPVDLSATFHSFRARLYHKCMRSALALLTALVSLISPARAQSPLLNSGLLNLGLAFPTATSKHIVLAFGGTCAATHTGVCADVEIGFEWVRPSKTLGDLPDEKAIVGRIS